MTTEEKWANYRKWKEKEHYRRELRKTHPDLADLYDMRNGLFYHLEELNDMLIAAIETKDEDETERLRSEIEFFDRVHAQIQKDSDELFEKYGEVDKCQAE